VIHAEELVVFKKFYSAMYGYCS